MYDPLHDLSPGQGQPYPDSYWAAHSGPAPADDGALTRDMAVDVAIIGAGYTGLSAAYHLATEHGLKALVLEANQTAWGCSGRNAGFVLKSSGRKPYAQMQKQWGEAVMRGVYQEFNAGLDRVRHLISLGIDCDQQEPGYLRMAHKPSMVPALQAQARLLQQTFGAEVELLSRSEVHQQYVADQQSFGALRFADAFGVNPLKLAWGYQQLARNAGAMIHTASPVQQWQTDGRTQVLHTPQAVVRARKVILATNGYTPKQLHPGVQSRTLPVLSQIIVTEPLSPAQLAACNLLTSQVVMDTRALKYYYRKLPDNRILFGGRGAITGRDAENPFYAERLLEVLKLSFPALHSLRYDHQWSGWICMSLDDIPHIYQADAHADVVYSMGYCGSGLSFSVQAGKRLADKVMGLAQPDLPLFQSALPKFPLAPLRRVGQWGYFHYGKLKDQWW
ncbi:MAG: FAD-binding oxidoreductase [Rheinheimera sp.]|nr:FAD-binding oxidoreductase [Rheinheimera sp.]